MAKADLTLDDIDDNEPDAPSQLRTFATNAGAKAAEAEAKAAELVRENAALRAGIDVGSVVGQGIMATYKGDIADTEALKAHAAQFAPAPAAAAPLEAAGAPAAAEPVPAQDNGTAARNAVNAGATSADQITQDPVEAALAQFHENTRKKGVPEDMARASMVSELMNAAAAEAAGARI